MTDNLDNGAVPDAQPTNDAQSLESVIAKTMGDVYDKAEVRDAPSSPGKGEEGGDTQPSGPTRNERGQFASNKPAEAAPETATPAAKTTDQPAKAEAAPAKPASEPPQSWSAAAKAEWTKLPPQIQAEIAKREGDVQKGFEQKAAETKPELEFAQAVKQRFAPYRDEMARRGVNETQALDYLITMEQFARRDPEAYARHVVKELGLDHLLASPGGPQNGAQQPTNGQAAPSVDPQVADLRRTVNGLVQHVQSERQSAQNRVLAEATSAISAFKADPANEHFDTVKEDMAVLIGSGRATDLKDAYEKAVWAHPETRAKLLAAQAKADDEKRASEAAAAAASARRAAGTPLRARGAPANAGQGRKTMEQTMAEAYDRATSAA